MKMDDKKFQLDMLQLSLKDARANLDRLQKQQRDITKLILGWQEDIVDLQSRIAELEK